MICPYDYNFIQNKWQRIYYIHLRYLILTLDSLDKTTKARIENAKLCLARRLARLTPSQVATLFALHPGKHAGFHGIVKITTNSRFHVRNPRAVASPSVIFLPAASSGEKYRASSTRGSLKFKCQSREDTSTYCRTRERERGEGGRGAERWRNECGVLLVSLRDVENGRRIAPMFALEFCSVDEDLKLQGYPSILSISVVL